jgi:hypothetical protein
MPIKTIPLSRLVTDLKNTPGENGVSSCFLALRRTAAWAGHERDPEPLGRL